MEKNTTAYGPHPPGPPLPLPLSTKGRGGKRRPFAAILIVQALALAACGSDDTTPAATASSSLTEVTTAVAESRLIPRQSQVSGTVEALRRVSPGTKILGRVEEVLAREGDPVGRDQLLARLESRDLDAAVVQAEAGIAMAEANLENARVHHRRMIDLHGRGSVTDKNLEDATAAFRVAEAALEQARANLEMARVTRSYAEVRSPIAGSVIEKRIEAGDMAQPGAPLFIVEDTRRVKVDVRVPETEVEGLDAGRPARINIVGRTYDAPVDRLVPAGDPASRTFSLQFLLDNDEGVLKSGMFARVTFSHGEQQVLRVPETALVTRGQLVGLFVVDDGKARLRWVKTGRREADTDSTAQGTAWVEILSGLRDGERYVVEPPVSLLDGAAVTER